MGDLVFHANSLHHIDLSLDDINPTEISDKGDLVPYILIRV